MNFERLKDPLGAMDIGLKHKAIHIFGLERRVSTDDGNTYTTREYGPSLNELLEKMCKGYLPRKSYMGYSNDNVNLEMIFRVRFANKVIGQISSIGLMGRIVEHEGIYYRIPHIDEKEWEWYRIKYKIIILKP